MRALNSGDTLTDTFVVDVNPANGRAKTQTITITISGRTDVLGTDGPDGSLGDASTSDNQAIFGFNAGDTLTGGSGDDLLVGGYGADTIDLSAGGTDTVVYRINSSDDDGLVKAEDGGDAVMEFTPGEDKLVILDVNGSPTTLTDLFDSLTGAFQLGINGDTDNDGYLSTEELDAGARAFLNIVFEASGTPDGVPTSAGAGRQLIIYFDRVTSEALEDMAVWDTLTGGTDFSSATIPTVALLSSLFGGFGRPGYDAALDDGGFISIIGPDDLPISGDETGSVTEGGAPGDDNTGTLTASGTVITLVSKKTTDSPGTSTGTYGVMAFDGTIWTYTLDDRAEVLADQQTATERFTFSAGGGTFVVTITITGANDDPTVSGEFFNRVGAAGGQFILSNLSDQFTDVDQGDELTFEVTLDDGAALSTIGLTYDSDEDEITGTLTETGSYVIKIVATDKSGATVEATFELNIFSAIPIIQRNSLTYNPDETSITIDETMLEVTSGNESDPALLVYTITTLPDAGMLLKSGTPLNNGDTFTQADINNGLITYVPSVSNPSTSQSNPLSFTISDGVATLEATLEITSREVVGNTIYEGDPSTSGDLDVNDDTLLDSTTPFTVSTQGDYGTASINDDGEWVYTLDNGNTDVRALNSGDTLTDTFVVDVTADDGSTQAQTITITINGRTDVLGTAAADTIDRSPDSDNFAIFGGNSGDTLTGGSGNDLIVGGFGKDIIDLSVGGADTVIVRVDSNDVSVDPPVMQAYDGGDDITDFTPGEDKLVIADIESTTVDLANFFSLTGSLQLSLNGDDDFSGDLSAQELADGARYFLIIGFKNSGTDDGGSGGNAGATVRVFFDLATSEALNGAYYDTITGGTNRDTFVVADADRLIQLFGGEEFFTIIDANDLPSTYFEQIISGDETGSVTEGGAPGDDNTGRLTAPGNTITLVSKETTDSPGMSTGTYGVMRFDGRIWTYTLDDRAEALADQQTETERFTFSAEGGIFVVTITITGANDAPMVSAEFFTGVGAAGGQFILTNLSDRFTDVDQGDELTFTVTLDDGAALSTIGLTYDSDEDEITGTLSQIGEHIIKIVATDKSGATVEATFDLNILPAISIIQRNSLTYNPDVTSITIDETMLEVTSGNASDPTLLVYTITTLPDAGVLLKSGTPLNNGDTFTQADINNGLITYVPDVGNPSTSQSNPLSFTISDGVATLEATLEITSREVVGNTASAQDNTADFSDVDVPQKIEAGDGSDIITGGQKDDQIDGGAGDDEIILTRTVNNVAEDAGADEVLYTFGYDGVGIDGGDEIVGFKRGQDKVTFVVQDSRQFTNLEEFLGSLIGADGEDLTADDAFVVTMQWGINSDGDFYFDGVLLHFKEGTSFGGGRVSSPLVTVTFDERLDLNDLIGFLGGAEKAADNFDFTHAAFKNLDEVLPRLFGESSIDFVVLPFSNSISVIDGPVTGAEVFFDIDDDGEVSDVEKDAQRDASGRSLYITGDDGSVSIPEEYVGLAFVADVDGAYDTATGERLEGAFRSLDEGRGGIATPITDLIVTYLEEVEGQAGTPTTGQEVLDEIFGDGEVTLADVLDAGNYEIPADTNTPENNKKDLISRAAIALTEIKENDDLADGDDDGSTTKVEMVSALKTLVDSPDDSSVADLKAAVDARVVEVNAVKGGKPIATPTSVDGVEDTDYAFPDTPEALTGLFGFRDPEGNDPAADTSSFRGVYIRIDIENASLRLDDNTQVVADTDLSGSDTVDAITGYVYVTFDKLSALKLSPAGDFNGDLALVYRVWDGEEVSSDAELIINIAGVNDAPTLVDDGVATRNVTVGEAVTDITQAYLLGLFNDIDGDALILMVTGLSSGLSHNSTDGITGTPTASGIITVTVVADDGNGGTVEKTLEIAVGQIMNALTGTISLADPTPPNNLQGAYGTLKFDAATKTWTYTLDAAATQALRAGEVRTETFTFTDATDGSDAEEKVVITVVGANDAPTLVDDGVATRYVPVNLAIMEIPQTYLLSLFNDVDDDELTLTVTLGDGAALSTIGLSYARDTGIIGTPDTVGTITVTVEADDGNGGRVEKTLKLWWSQP